MPTADERLRALADENAKFLRQKKVAALGCQPYLVRWVREFLLFAGTHGGETFEQTLDLPLAEMGGPSWRGTVANRAGRGRDSHLPSPRSGGPRRPSCVP